MFRTSSLSRPIIESLYSEALLLADEVRAVFALRMGDQAAGASDELRLVLSSEGLKATTRMMHVLAWLLNQRAFFSGELNEMQLRRHGRLPEDRDSCPEDMELLEPATRALIQDTIHLHRRISRLDEAWSEHFAARPMVHNMHERLGRALGQR
ncbi:MAG: AraC family transcriptional regulator [Sphingomonadales bacterium BRH_c3]|nr:MAG: AraC family transcriptional regulator [Sphingomonadales bacterium BRH_c3]